MLWSLESCNGRSVPGFRNEWKRKVAENTEYPNARSGSLLIFGKVAGAGFFVLRWLLLGHDAGDGVAVAAVVDGEVFFVDGDEMGLRVLLREGDKGGVGKVLFVNSRSLHGWTNRFRLCSRCRRPLPKIPQ